MIFRVSDTTVALEHFLDLKRYCCHIVRAQRRTLPVCPAAVAGAERVSACMSQRPHCWGRDRRQPSTVGHLALWVETLARQRLCFILTFCHPLGWFLTKFELQNAEWRRENRLVHAQRMFVNVLALVLPDVGARDRQSDRERERETEKCSMNALHNNHNSSRLCCVLEFKTLTRPE